MKKLLLTAVFTLILLLPTGAANADQYVHGYTRSNGTYVQGYYRSSPDGNPYNNFSFPGNTNPYTGVTAGGSIESYLRNYYSSSGGYTPSYTPTYTNSYSYPTTPTCPLNSYYNGSSCTCSYGYVASGGSCVSGNSYCWAKTGIMSSYDSLSNSCKCDSGYQLDSFGTCVYKSPSYYTPTYPTCPLNAHLSTTDFTTCYCNTGYQLNSLKTGCVLPTQADLNKMCTDYFGSHTVSTGILNTDGTTNCNCQAGYQWNSSRTSCVKS